MQLFNHFVNILIIRTHQDAIVNIHEKNYFALVIQTGINFAGLKTNLTQTLVQVFVPNLSRCFVAIDIAEQFEGGALLGSPFWMQLFNHFVNILIIRTHQDAIVNIHEKNYFALVIQTGINFAGLKTNLTQTLVQVLVPNLSRCFVAIDIAEQFEGGALLGSPC